MRRRLHAAVAAAWVLGLPGTSPTRSQAPTGVLAHYDLEHRSGHVALPGRLREISGLAMGADGLLYTHNDERGVVYRITPDGAKVDHGFFLGPKPVHGDFEGIAIAGSRFFLVSSRAWVYAFQAGKEGESVPFSVVDTHLGNGCEVEGLAYDSSENSLLLACKTLAPPSPEIRIHRLRLDAGAPALPPIRASLAGLAAFGIDGPVHPSGLEVAPGGGSLVLLAARERLIIEIDRQGRILNAARFKGKQHHQPEGITFGADGRLYVSDEGGHGDGMLTWYEPRPSGKGGSWDGA